MAGLESILSEINSQGMALVEAETAAAEKKAAKIKAQGDEDAASAYEEYLLQAERKAELESAAVCSAADAEAKRAALSCRSECIDKAVQTALEKLSRLGDKEYFDLIVVLAKKSMRSGSGVIQFSQRDLKRMPSDLEQRLQQAAKEKASQITISKEAADIENGFILSYGLISENCSFADIVDAQRDAVRDLAASVLFG